MRSTPRSTKDGGFSKHGRFVRRSHSAVLLAGQLGQLYSFFLMMLIAPFRSSMAYLI